MTLRTTGENKRVDKGIWTEQTAERKAVRRDTQEEGEMVLL